MGWERRGNRWHFSTARRIGGRVVKEYVTDADAPLDGIADLVHRAAMLAAGYHRHKGQWRKRRG